VQGQKSEPPERGHLTGGSFYSGAPRGISGYLRRLVQLSVVWTRPEGGPIRAGRFPIGSGGGGGESADQKILFRGRRLKGPNRSTFVTIAQSKRSRKWRLLMIKINSCRS
jgi:hypothetical protein